MRYLLTLVGTAKKASKSVVSRGKGGILIESFGQSVAISDQPPTILVGEKPEGVWTMSKKGFLKALSSDMKRAAIDGVGLSPMKGPNCQCGHQANEHRSRLNLAILAKDCKVKDCRCKLYRPVS
ncbi:hypothetical protein A2V80_00885 [Candidatus Woesebacteria bacterium RBG_16_39_8b]|uniref:Uncharacterized protein n=1 Tax=Candidatus Woesebacteria bacterium RBG_16_39_8b TaxID=1802482 RepID=A0A1F7XC37_9BACT|nr:MAG: hypothetical protein A2V80_00885 [Candidatus Woesebacteria bacterium RBG_16_39_8b]